MRKAAIRIALLAGLVFACLWAGSEFVWAELPDQPRFSWQIAVPIQPERYTFNLYCSDDGEPVAPTAADLKFEALPYNPEDGNPSRSFHLSALGDFPPGSYECGMTAILTGLESDMSNTVSFSVPLPAPTNLLVE